LGLHVTVIDNLLEFLLLPLYFLPAVIAAYRSHPRTGTIVFLNILGFTWPIALIWALNGQPKKVGAR
jgi:hypothetical protein